MDDQGRGADSGTDADSIDPAGGAATGDEAIVQPQPGENNIAEGKVGGLMGGPNQQHGQGQGG